MKRVVTLAALAVIIGAAPAYAQNTSVIAGGPHDLSAGSALRTTNAAINGQTCVFCHTPHGGSISIPLWNRNAPSGAAYQLYTSSTMSSNTTAAQVASGVTGACMSCHDGTIAVDVLAGLNGLPFGAAVAFTKQSTAKSTYSNAGTGTSNVMSGGLPFLGTDLRNDHPVAIVYETARAGNAASYVTQAITGTKITVGVSAPLPLYGTSTSNATVECASCHNPHNNSLGNFLRKANTGSAMCLTCHIK
jgi:predicted CXXCH cytochrome family protein